MGTEKNRKEQPSIPASVSAVDRRNWERQQFPEVDAEIAITMPAKILDESPAGIGLLLARAGDLKINQQIEIRAPKNMPPVVGRVANLQLTESGFWRLGIELDESCLPGKYDLT